MDLISEVKIAAAALPRKITVILANMGEANMLLDKIPVDEYPIMLVLPFTVVDNREVSGLWAGTVDFNAMLLDRDASKTTLDYDTSEVEIQFTAPLRRLARRFFNELNKSELLFQPQVISNVSYTPTYGEFDAHVHGVIVRVSLKIAEGNEC